jgi:hypothetical protein
MSPLQRFPTLTQSSSPLIGTPKSFDCIFDGKLNGRSPPVNPAQYELIFWPPAS